MINIVEEISCYVQLNVISVEDNAEDVVQDLSFGIMRKLMVFRANEEVLRI